MMLCRFWVSEVPLVVEAVELLLMVTKKWSRTTEDDVELHSRSGRGRRRRFGTDKLRRLEVLLLLRCT